MIFYLYCVYDSDMEAFDNRINLSPLGPSEMAEQYRRAATKMTDVQKAEADGKKVILLGEFDDVEGKISQGRLLEVFVYHKDKKEPEGSNQVREESEDSPNA